MYVKLDKKTRVNSELYTTVDEIKDWVLSGKQVGWLVEDGYIVIDIDNMDSAKAVYKAVTEQKIKCLINKTRKGMHFFFKTPKFIPQGVALHTPIGIKVDTRVANKGYVVLPVNDAEREVLVDCELENCSIIPYWLIPLKININNEEFVKVGMKEGDGRNDALMKQVWRLKGALFKAERIRECINIINDFVFETKLQRKELDSTVLREDMLNLELQLKEKKFDHVQMAEELLNSLGFKIKYYNRQFYLYSDGVYKLGEQLLYEIMIGVYPRIKKSQRTEVIEYLKIVCYTESFTYNDKYVNVANGIYNLESGTILDHQEHLAGINQLKFNYSPGKVVRAVDDFLLDICNGKEERKLLLIQWIGYMISNSIREQKMLFLYGEKASNGKSTFLNLIDKLVGEENRATQSLDQIVKNRFMLPELDGKIFNYQADISAEFIKDTSIIKSIVTGDSLTLERKGERPFTTKLYAKLVFGMNEIPKAPKDEGWYRRMTIIPFERVFSGAEFFDEGSINNQDALDYLGTLALDTYRELYNKPARDDKKWANYEESYQLLEKYKEDTDNALAFLNQAVFYKTELDTKDYDFIIEKSALYNKYVEYCEEDHLNVKAKNTFGKTAKNIFKETKHKNKMYWIIDQEKYKVLEKKPPELKSDVELMKDLVS